MSFTITVRLIEQVDVVGQLLRRVFHLILQLLVLCLAHPFGDSSPYRLKVNGWIVGPNHRKGVSNGGNNDIAVEALEILPRRFAPLDDGVRTRWPTVGLRSRRQVDTVEHRFNSGDYGVELVPLGPGLLH